MKFATRSDLHVEELDGEFMVLVPERAEVLQPHRRRRTPRPRRPRLNRALRTSSSPVAAAAKAHKAGRAVVPVAAGMSTTDATYTDRTFTSSDSLTIS